MSEFKPKIPSRGAPSDAKSSFAALVFHPLTICLLLFAFTLFIYWPVTHHDFVEYDDGDYVTRNGHVQEGLTWAGVKWAFTSGEASNWHPLTWLSHMLDVTLFGMKAGGHHLTSVVIHCFNAVLLLLLMRRLTGALWQSVVVAALFALHPLHVESVAWVSERKDVLSTFFGFLSLIFYVRHAQAQTRNSKSEVRSPKSESRLLWLSSILHSPSSLGCSLFFFALGLMSKPMLVTLPFALLLLDWWPLKRFAICDLRFAISKLVREKLPFLALSAVSSIVTFLVQKEGGSVSTVLPLSARLANALVAYVEYLWKTFWPFDLSALYPHPGHWPVWHVVGAALLLGLLTFVAVASWKRRPFVTVGWFWFVGMLVPVIGLVQVGIHFMADRYTYLPLIGVFIALVWSAGAALARWPTLKPAFGVLAILALGICSLLTRVQLRVWANSEMLFRHAVAVTRDNYFAYNNLGFYLADKGRREEAVECYRASLRIRPGYAEANNNLGYALAGQRKFSEAIEHYRTALLSLPENTKIRNNLANALTETRDLNAAIAEYEFVLKRNPDYADAHNNFGNALAMKGRLEEAMIHFREALRLKPENASAHGNLGNAFAIQRKFAEATYHYREALRLSPTDAQTLNNLGNVLAEQGQFAEAVTNYRAALELHPDNPEAHYNLGCMLARLGQSEEAGQQFREALKLKPAYVEAQKQLEKLATPGKP